MIAAARPADAVVEDATAEQALRAVQRLDAVAARPDLPTALELASLRFEAVDAPPSRATLIVLDDWASAHDRAERRLPESVAGLGQRATIRVLSPAPAVRNAQVASITPRRRTQVVNPGSSVVAATVGLRRFADADPGTASLTLELARPVGTERGAALEAVRTQRREVRWSAGQAEARVNFELSAPEAGALRERSHWALRAALDDTAGGVGFDDQRLAWITLRPSLRVAVVAARSDAAADAWSPPQWISVALAPTADEQGGFGVRRHEPLNFDREAIRRSDAVFVLSPQRLAPATWTLLGDAVRSGLALWVWPPPDVTDTAASDRVEGATWFEAMAQSLGLNWTVAAEPVALAAPGERLRESDAPPALSLLGADWADLLRPVRVRRYWPLAGASDDALWLTLRDGSPILAARAVGEGAVLLSTTAADPAWTNLPTKPLLVPLLHESLRGVIGGDPVAGRTPIATPVVGDERPAGTWRRVWTPHPPRAASPDAPRRDGEAPLDAARAAVDETVDAADDAAVSATDAPNAPQRGPAVFDRVGLYLRASNDEPRAAGRRVAVNADAPAGNTAALSESALRRWLEPLGPWGFAAADELASASFEAGPRVSLAWPLLWVVLALVVMETVLGRVFSHAQTGGGAAEILGRLWQRLWRPRAAASREGAA